MSGWGALRARPAVLVAVIGLISACGVPTVSIPAAPSAPTATATSRPTAAIASAAAVSSPRPTAQASCVEAVLQRMTTAQRTGQLFLLGLADDQLGQAERSAIQDEHVGSVWFTDQTSIGVAGIRAIAAAVQAQANAPSTAGVGFFIAANQEGGRIQALAGPGFSTIPSAVGQGEQSTNALTADAAAWGRQLRAAGVNLDFAPVVDVVPPGDDTVNQPIGVLEREYGHDPLTAGGHAAAFIAGMAQAGVATTAKHFPGLGRVVGNTDVTAGVVDAVTAANGPYLASFRAAVGAGVPFVMVALATYTRIDPAHPAAFSTVVMNGLLRGGLGFRGVIMSDDLGATAAVATMPPGERALEFLLAGGDLIVSRTAAATAAMVAAVQARVGTDPRVAARVDDAVRRVLAAKQVAGLLSCPG